MSDPISTTDVEGLATKLEALSGSLTEGEKALLAGVVAGAFRDATENADVQGFFTLIETPGLLTINSLRPALSTISGNLPAVQSGMADGSVRPIQGGFQTGG
jgi:hypothetical protein